MNPTKGLAITGLLVLGCLANLLKQVAEASTQEAEKEGKFIGRDFVDYPTKRRVAKLNWWAIFVRDGALFLAAFVFVLY